MELKFAIGTTNPNKVREIGAILQASGCEFVQTDPVDPEETEADFVGNALIKGRAYAAHSGLVTISEDSGLLVPSLGNLPGPWSARFSECEIDRAAWKILRHAKTGLSREEIDPRNNALVLELMRGIDQPRRAAMFKVVFVVAKPDGEILFQGTGESYGWIADEARGSNGFGYDPIFVGQDTFGKTYAEIDAHRKNLRSHRRAALQEFKAWLARYVMENR